MRATVILLLLSCAVSQQIVYLLNLKPDVFGGCCTPTQPTCISTLKCSLPMAPSSACAPLLNEEGSTSGSCGADPTNEFGWTTTDTNITLSFGMGGISCDRNPPQWPLHCSSTGEGIGFPGIFVQKLFFSPTGVACAQPSDASLILDKICAMLPR